MSLQISISISAYAGAISLKACLLKLCKVTENKLKHEKEKGIIIQEYKMGRDRAENVALFEFLNCVYDKYQDFDDDYDEFNIEFEFVKKII